MDVEFVKEIEKELAEKKTIVVQVRDDEIDWLLEHFPNAVVVEHINNYSNFSISMLPEDSVAEKPLPNTVFIGFYRDGHYSCHDILSIDEFKNDFAVKYRNFEPELHQYTLEKPESDVKAEWPASQTIVTITFYENGHWHTLRRECKDSAESFSRKKARLGIKCKVNEYFYAGEVEVDKIRP